MERRLPLTDWKTQGFEMLVLPRTDLQFQGRASQSPSRLVYRD